MQCLDEKAFEDFRKLHDCVNTSFEEIREETEKKLRRLKTSIRWHFYLTILIISPFLLLGSGSTIAGILSEIFSNFTPSRSFMIAGSLLYFFFILFISEGVRRRTRNMSILLLIYSTTVLPLWVYLPSVFLEAASIQIIISGYVGIVFYVFLIWFVMWILQIVRLRMPYFLFILFSSVSRETSDTLVPGYIKLAHYAAVQVIKGEKFYSLTRDDWHRIETIVRWKFDGINGRLQAFSFGIGALGFLGILALFFSQEEIRLSLEQLQELWNRYIAMQEAEFAEYDVPAFLVLMIVGVVFVLAARYFARSYIELRVLEAMGIICSLAASGSADRQRSAPTLPSAPLPAPAPPDAAPSPGAAATVVPVASVVSGNTSDAAQSVGDSSSSAAAPPPCSAPGNKASGDAAPSASTAGASARSSGEPLNAPASSAGQALAPAEATPPCVAPASGTPDTARLPGDSLSDVADTPASSDTHNDPPARADHRS